MSNDPKKEGGKEQQGESYHEMAEVNGIDISVGWDQSYGNYTIYFPQIKLGEEVSARGVHDKDIRLTRRPEVAKQIFDYALKEAESTKNVYDLYLKVEAFARTLPYDTDEDVEAEKEREEDRRAAEKASKEDTIYEEALEKYRRDNRLPMMDWQRAAEEYPDKKEDETRDRLIEMIKNKEEVWVQRSSGEWQKGRAIEMDYPYAVSIGFIDRQHPDKLTWKRVPTEKFLKWQEEGGK